MSTPASPARKPLHPGAARRPWLLGVTLAVAVALAAGGVILSGRFGQCRSAWDQDYYHLRVVRQFAAELWTPDLSEYRSATTPGYHLALAAASRAIGDGERAMRLAGLLFSAGLVCTLGWALARRTSCLVALALAAPCLCSTYVFGSAAWVTPDNAGWWGVLGVVLTAWARKVDARAAVVGGIVLAALVLCRQIHLWTAGVLVLGAWIRAEKPGGIPELEREPPGPRASRAMIALACAIPAVLIVAGFARLWGGLVTPMFQAGGLDPVLNQTTPRNQGGNPAAPALVFALAGVYGVFFSGFAWGALRRAMRGEWRARLSVGLSMGVAFLACALPRTGYDYDAGRRGALWNVAARFPAPGGRSVLVLALGVLGGAVLGLFFASLSRRQRWLWLWTWVLFMLTQAASLTAFQRYIEPFVLMLLALGASRITPAPMGPVAPSDAPARDGSANRAPWAAAGPSLLALGLAAVTVLSLGRDN
ncbi:MAG: hypothetical protein JNM07_12560 [Phycisphaerae bacterium]|nr:hypothetical protein [Phycisphaerae bacterium]